FVAAMPQSRGFYAWITQGLGPFWGGFSAWLSLVSSCFDMAVYPTLLVAYLARLWPVLEGTEPGQPGWWLAVGTIFCCVVWNLLGARRVGLFSLVLIGALLGPFLMLIFCAAWHIWQAGGLPDLQSLRPPAGTGALWADGVVLCMWNYG